MSEQSLRDALETLIEGWRYKGDDMKPWQEGGGPGPGDAELDYAASEINKLLAAHPAEPYLAPKVDRGALEDIIDACGTGDLTTRRATDAVLELFHRRALASGEIAAELARHGTLVFDSTPHCPCGHEYKPLPQGGVSWDQQNKHRADAVLALINGTSAVIAGGIR